MQNRQNKFKMHYYYIATFFEGHFGGSGATPHITRRNFFLSETCSEFIFRKSQLTPIILSFQFFVDVRKSERGVNFTPPCQG